MAVFLRTRRAQLPCYVFWRMMREGLYAYGLEPCNSPFGSTDELLAQGWPLMLEPGERRAYELDFGVVTGEAAVDALIASITGPRSSTDPAVTTEKGHDTDEHPPRCLPGDPRQGPAGDRRR